MLTLILGGARSGKSRLAENLASTHASVVYLATAIAGGDQEMAARIYRHQSDRPSSWRTVEEPLALADAVRVAARSADAVIVDCLTVWLSNLFWAHREGPSGEAGNVAREQLSRMAAAAGPCEIILVSNELGSGTVPEHSVTREFRDEQGWLNQRAAELADEVILTVAGLPLYLKESK